MTAPSELAGGLTIPEIGPSLGRLTDPPGTAAGALGLTLDDARVALVGGVFELAGASRRLAAAGDRAGALRSLGRAAWLEAWERAVAAVALQITDAANAGFEAAAAESRLPARRLASLRLTSDDTQAAIARLGAGGVDFIAALDALGPTATAAASDGRDAWRAWQDALGAAARRLESAWRAVEAQAAAEQSRWAGQIARVRAWRRPMWPLWLITTIVVAAAAYFGLVLGGYVPVPPPLQGFAAFVWAHQWT